MWFPEIFKNMGYVEPASEVVLNLLRPKRLLIHPSSAVRCNGWTRSVDFGDVVSYVR
jgi:hypothetical protein